MPTNYSPIEAFRLHLHRRSEAEASPLRSMKIEMLVQLAADLYSRYRSQIAREHLQSGTCADLCFDCGLSYLWFLEQVQLLEEHAQRTGQTLRQTRERRQCEKCGRPQHGKGLCLRHYRQAWRAAREAAQLGETTAPESAAASAAPAWASDQLVRLGLLIDEGDRDRYATLRH
jgi:hypothetical protein